MSTTRTRPRRAVLALFVVLAWGAGCSLDFTPRPDVRALDDMCKGSACATSGSARRTSGVTADSVGYQLGPGSGAVDIPVDSSVNTLSVLVRGKGHFYLSLVGCSGCPRVTREATADYTWVDLYSVDDGGVPGYDAGPEAGPYGRPSQYTIELSVEDDGSHIDVADFKSFSSCSVAPAGPR